MPHALPLHRCRARLGRPGGGEAWANFNYWPGLDDPDVGPENPAWFPRVVLLSVTLDDGAEVVISDGDRAGIERALLHTLAAQLSD